jgi:hypothetical protein
LRAYYSTNPFVVWRGEGKRKSCARVRLNKASEKHIKANLGAQLRFFWSADILVRFAVDLSPKADKHVRAPITKAEGVGKI